MSADPKLRRAFQVIVVLLALVLFLGGWLIRDRINEREKLAMFHPASVSGNMVREWYPGVDWGPIYPDYSAEEIDQIQRQTFDVRYVYSPYVQFRALPMRTNFVEIAPAGFRKNAGPLHPWPPEPTAFNVFMFGGSTTFGNGLPDSETVVAHLEREFQSAITNQTVRCYNFGTGYYFFTQERLLFEDLLLNGLVPKIAIFIDGLNDFRQVEGFPEFTPSLHERMAPDIPFTGYQTPQNDQDRAVAAKWVLQRYQRNLRLIESAGKQAGAATYFIGQPIPYGDYPINPQTYPFKQPNEDHRLCAFAYPQFAQLAQAEAFGPNFIWAADAFRNATEAMYCDAVHYSPRGAKRLARVIFERVFEKHQQSRSGPKP